MKKSEVKGTKYFYLVDPSELDTTEEWAEYLESILNGQCTVLDIEGELTLLDTKVLVEKVNGLRMEIYTREHNPPHFHVHSEKVNASFLIEDCSLLNGHVSGNDLDKIRYWHKLAKPRLVDLWKATRPTICTVGIKNNEKL